MKTRNKVIIIGLCGAGVLAFGVCALWLFYSILSGQMLGYQRPPVPAQLKQPRVTIGKDFLLQSKFSETAFLESVNGISSIKDVAVGELDSHPGLDVVIAGRNGALVYDRNGAPQGRTIFQLQTEQTKLGPFTSPKTLSMLGDIQVVDLEGDGICEYLARGSMDGAAVFNHQGQLLWSYGKFTAEKLAISNLTVGDLDGDHIAEFVASWRGIEVFDKSGKRMARVEEEYGDSQVEVVDTDGDGKNEILSCGATLKIRDSVGRVIKTVEIPIYLGDFFLSKMPGREQPVILGVYEGSIWLIDLEGQVIGKFDAPLSKFDDTIQQTPVGEMRGTSVYKAEAVWVKLAQGQPEYLAVITEFAAIDRSVLDVYTAAGQLVYQEVLPEECLAIAVLPPEDQSGIQEFLVGGEKTVWRYRSGQSKNTRP